MQIILERNTRHPVACLAVNAATDEFSYERVTMKAIKKLDNYRMYKVGDYYELWHGKYNAEQKAGVGVRVGYVSNPANFEMACHEAESEIMWLMKQEA